MVEVLLLHAAPSATDARQQTNTMTTIAKVLKPIVSWTEACRRNEGAAQLVTAALGVCLIPFLLIAKRPGN